MDADEIGPTVNETIDRGIIADVSSVGMCARFRTCPKESHLKVVKRILRYLKKMGNLVLFYPLGDSFELVGYADAECQVDE